MVIGCWWVPDAFSTSITELTQVTVNGASVNLQSDGNFTFSRYVPAGSEETVQVDAIALITGVSNHSRPSLMACASEDQLPSLRVEPSSAGMILIPNSVNPSSSFWVSCFSGSGSGDAYRC